MMDLNPLKVALYILGLREKWHHWSLTGVGIHYMRWVLLSCMNCCWCFEK